MTPSEILTGFSAADPETLNYVYRNYRAKITAHLMRNRASREDAEGVFQNVMISLLRQTSSRGLTELSCTFEHFLFVCCERQWYKTLKREKRRVEVTNQAFDVPEEEAQVLKTLRSIDIRQAIQASMQQLDEPCFALLQLYFHASKSQREIAEQTGIQYATLRKRINRCRNKLRELLSEHPLKDSFH
jgi:RNA polymerase sigma factor (sigma-70 family)